MSSKNINNFVIDILKNVWYNVFCSGEVSERFKELVLKTSDSQEPWVRIPLSPPINNSIIYIYFDLRKYPRGRRGSPAKGVGV